MQLFYIPEISGDLVTLDETESKHAIKVLRMSVGDRVQIVDGKGGIYDAKIADVHPKKCQLSIVSSQKESSRKNYRLHIAIAPTKNIARFEWFLEKTTELGIDEITPLLTEQSERKVLKYDRLEKILVAAMKQSQKTFLPRLNKLISFEDFIQQTVEKEKFIAHCFDGEKKHLKNAIRKENDLLVLIGPEGDFSLEEVVFAKQNGFEEISLGYERLRTETAGVVACHIANLMNE